MSDLLENVKAGIVSHLVSVVMGAIGVVFVGLVGYLWGDFVSAWIQFPGALGAWSAAVLCVSFAAGWAFRALRYKWKREAEEASARIERENAEHAERMRRDREEYEAAKARAAEQETLREAEERKANAAVAAFQSVAGENEEICMFAIAIHERGGSVILAEDIAGTLEEIDDDYHPLLNTKPIGGRKEKVSIRDWVAVALERDQSLVEDYSASDDLDKVRKALVNKVEEAKGM